MNDYTFNSQMRRIKACFSAAYNNDEKIAIIWEKVKHLSDDRFITICDNFISRNKQAPAVSEFIDMASSNEFSTNYKEIRGSCGKCVDGVVFLEKASGSPYVFKCNCNVGFQRLENWPRHQEHYLLQNDINPR